MIFAGCQSSVRFAKNAHPGQSPEKKTKAEYSEYESNSIVDEAERWLGTPYCYGGESKNCTDCSGFVMSVYGKFGLKLPRTAREQYIFAGKVKINSKRAGDLVFFRKNGKIYHVGIYAGNNQVIHASSSKGVIKQSLSDSYLSKRLAGIGRINL